MSSVGQAIRHLFPGLGAAIDYSRLPATARGQQRLDKKGVPKEDPGIDRCVQESLAWIGRAQDRSPTADGGVARDFSLVDGWRSSYPETTGYIVPTMLDCANRFKSDDLRARGLRMLDWLVAIQFNEGGFQGGRVDSVPRVPVTFNTGQILIGLARGVQEDEKYLEPMHKAAKWLVDTQDSDGCWRNHATPFAAPGEKSYETHVAWGLFEADRVAPNCGYGEAGQAQVRWALGNQTSNGWFEKCCLDEPVTPLTHTIGYMLRGILEAHRWNDDGELQKSAELTAGALIKVVDDQGYLPGRLDADWNSPVAFSCLTGTVQIAHCLLMLYQLTGYSEYRDTAYRMNKYVRRTVIVDGPDNVRGGVKGSFPVNGSYGRFEYLNWAAKFFIDANLLELDIRQSES